MITNVSFNSSTLWLFYPIMWAPPVVQMVENLPAMQETRVQSLGQEDSLEKEMATHSSILAWEIPWTKEPDGLQPMRLQKVGHDWAIKRWLSHYEH